MRASPQRLFNVDDYSRDPLLDEFLDRTERIGHAIKELAEQFWDLPTKPTAERAAATLEAVARVESLRAELGLEALLMVVQRLSNARR